MKEYTVGDQIRYLRMSKNIKQEDLIRGLCSKTVCSRIENGVQESDYFLEMALLSRLGYSPEIEAILDDETYKRYIEREKIRDAFTEKDFAQLTKLLEDFENSLEENEILHRQFAYMYRAKAEQMKENKSLEMELEYDKKALSITTDLKELGASGTLYFTAIEMYLIIEIARLEQALGMERQAEQKLKRLLESINMQMINQEEKVKIYSAAALQYANILYQKGMYTDVFIICEKAIETLKKNTQIFYYADLLLLKAKAMENMSEVEREDCQETYYMAYSILSLYEERKSEQEQIKKYIEEKYGWEVII